MLKLEQLIKPTWGAEKWIGYAWDLFTDSEKETLKNRLDTLFSQGLPFQLEHDNILYVYLFSLVCQFETLGMQIPLRVADKLGDPKLQVMMRQQLLDETFHALIAFKIAQDLSAPYAIPPTYNASVENFMSHLVHDEPDMQTAIILTNLIGEGLIGEIFHALQKHQVAPRVFDVILADEDRHLQETDLYLMLGLPEKSYLVKRLAALEEELLSTVFFQSFYVLSLINILGITAVLDLIKSIDRRHQDLLLKIGIEPSAKWRYFMNTIPAYVQDVFHDHTKDTRVTLTPTRKMLAAVWDKPNNPTMSSVFSLNVTALQFFEKKYSPETLTCLMLQTISQVLFEKPMLRNYIFHNKTYNATHAYVGLAVKLPDCGDHLGLIVFRNCHTMNIAELAACIKNDLDIMQYCYKKTEQLRHEHPYLMDIFDDLLTSRHHRVHADPLFSSPTVSLSNIGHWGYETVVSPLLPNETMKLCLGKIERKQVWNNEQHCFEIQDMLPVGLSVDHRAFDGNIPVPYWLQAAFTKMFEKMTHHLPSASLPSTLKEVMKLADRLLLEDLELGFRYLFLASQVWRHGSAKDASLMSMPEQLNDTLCSAMTD